MSALNTKGTAGTAGAYTYIIDDEGDVSSISKNGYEIIEPAPESLDLIASAIEQGFSGDALEQGIDIELQSSPRYIIGKEPGTYGNGNPYAYEIDENGYLSSISKNGQTITDPEILDSVGPKIELSSAQVGSPIRSNDSAAIAIDGLTGVFIETEIVTADNPLTYEEAKGLLDQNGYYPVNIKDENGNTYMLQRDSAYGEDIWFTPLDDEGLLDESREKSFNKAEQLIVTEDGLTVESQEGADAAFVEGNDNVRVYINGKVNEFATYDFNGDGFIDLTDEEEREAFETEFSEEARAIVNPDGLDKIDQETFKENINKVMLKRMVAFADQEAFDTFATATLSDTNEKAIDLKKNNLPEIEGFDYADYDSNKDGYIDKAEFSALFDAMELSTLGAEREDQQDTNLVRYTVPGTDEEVIEIIHPQAREFPKMLEEVFGTEENPKYDDEDNNLAAKAIINYLQKKDGVYTLQFQTSGVASSATGNMVTNISNNESSITPFVFIHEMVHEMGGADFNELLKDTQYAGLYGERTAFDELAEMDPDGEGDKEKSSKDAYHFGDNPGGRFLNDAIEAELKYDNWHSIHLNGQIATTEMMNELSPDQWRDLLDIAEAGIYTPNEIGQMLQNTTSYEIGYAQIMNSINS